MEADAILVQWRRKEGGWGATLEPKGIRRAELVDQISEVQLPELFWDEGEEELRNIRAWIWRGWKWKGVFFGWQKYKWRQAGGPLGWSDKWESGLLEGPAVLGGCMEMLMPQWMGVGVELLAKMPFLQNTIVNLS